MWQLIHLANRGIRLVYSSGVVLCMCVPVKTGTGRTKELVRNLWTLRTGFDLLTQRQIEENYKMSFVSFEMKILSDIMAATLSLLLRLVRW